MEKSSIVLFDGYCNLCSWSVLFVIRRDPRAHFRFVALQSESGTNMLAESGVDPERVNSVALAENGRLYTRSTAVLRILRKLRGPWPVLYALIIIPGFIRNPVYDWVARKRYGWFGRKQQCFVPDQDILSRFLN